MKKIILALLALSLTLTLLAGCKENKEKDTEQNTDTKAEEPVDFEGMSAEELSEYIELGEYKGLQITLGGADKGEAVWKKIIAGSTVKKYPEAQVEYYKAQTVAQYEYYADEAEMSLEELLAKMDITEAQMLDEARALVKSDLVYHAILKAEGITLSDSEKDQLFDKYVEKYVDDYGYSEEYVRKNMSHLIYESMLYDKTTEFLIANNNFT